MVGRKGGDNSGGETRDDGVVIQWVVYEVGSGTVFPVLTERNYSEWATLMKVKLKARGF
jgi:hypothetical protein